MKKYYLSSLFILFIITTVFAFGVFVTNAFATTTSSGMTISQFVELLITIGAVPADRVLAARAMVVTLSANPPVITNTITSPTPYIQVLSPNGGESWDIDVDVARTITWGSTGQIPVTVSFVPAKGAACDLMLAPIISKNGNNSLAVKLKTALCYNQATGSTTPLKDGSYKVRVAYKMGTSTISQDESNAVFKINPQLIPSLKVTYPNGGEQLIRNREYAIKYTLKNEDDSNDGLIYYYLLDNNGNSVNNGHKALRNGTFDLDLPSSLSTGAYKLKLKLTTDDDRIELEDLSDNYFWVSTGL